MVRNMEKILKIECPKRVPKLKTETIEAIPTPLELNLTNIEPYTEPGTTVHIDLNLDQLEDADE
jgi:hypothetical protein